MTASTAAAFALAVGAACTSFGSDDTASDGGPDATTDVAAPDVADGAVTDAPSTSDVAVVGDDFCTAHRNDPGFVYCNDFELPTSGASPYGFGTATGTPTTTSINVTSDGTRHAVLKLSVSSTDAGSHDITLTQSMGIGTGGPLPLIVDLDVKILAVSEPSITAAAIHVAGFNCEGSYGLGVFDGTTVGGTRSRNPTPQPFVAGDWQHLTISLLKSASSTTGYRELTTYAGRTLVDREAHASNGDSPTACTTTDFLVGISETESDPATITLLFDNVLARKPQ